MTPSINPEQLFDTLSDIRMDIKGVHERLDLLNGRTRALENRMAVVWAALGGFGAYVTAQLTNIIPALLKTIP